MKDLIYCIIHILFIPVRAILSVPLYPFVVIRTYIFAIKSFETWRFILYGWIWWFIYIGLFGSIIMLFLYTLFGRGSEGFDPFAEPHWILEESDVSVTFVSAADIKRGVKKWL